MAKKTKMQGDSIATITAACEATITVPLADAIPPNTSCRAHVDAHLRGNHGATMIRLRQALDRSDARTRDGKHVHTMTDVMKWLLEQIEDAIPVN